MEVIEDYPFFCDFWKFYLTTIILVLLFWVVGSMIFIGMLCNDVILNLKKLINVQQKGQMTFE
jgi:hypothetical protein